MAAWTLIFCYLAIVVHARYNLDNFQFPSKAEPVPELIAGDTINATWVSSFALNVMTLWCGENVKVFTTDNLPFQGAFQLNVTEAWTFPCHFQMAKQDDFGWFDSGEMDGSKEERDPQVFSANSEIVCPVSNDTATTIPQITSAPTVTITVAPSSGTSTKMGEGIGIGLGIAVLVASLTGGILYWYRRRKHEKAAILARDASEKPQQIYAYRDTSIAPGSGAPAYIYNSTGVGHERASESRTPHVSGGYVNADAVELNNETGPYELHNK